MKNKTHSKLPMLPLLRCEAVPITDPAAQAAVDRLFELQEGQQLSKADKKLLLALSNAKKPKARKRK